MKQVRMALGQFASDNPWLIPALAVASGLGTFYLAGPIIGLVFTAAMLLVLFLAALNSLGRQRTVAVDISERQETPAAPEAAGAADPPLSDQTGQKEDERAVADGSTVGSLDTDPMDLGERDSFHLAFDHALEGDLDALKAVYATELAKASTDEEKSKCKALHEFLLVKGGDADALSRLRDLADDKTVLNDGLWFYASALNLLGEREQAVKLLTANAEGLSAVDRAGALLQAARMLVEGDEGKRAVTLVAPLTGSPDLKAPQRAEAWQLIARSTGKLFPLEALAAYEESLSLDPSSADSRFSLAYLYSDHGFDELAHHHYSVLEDTNRASAVVLNNLGVCEDRMGMKGKSLAHYRKAGEAGSALGWANLSQVLISVGDFSHAESAIEKGETLDKSDPRVIAARERLTAERENEAETLTDRRQQGVPVRARVLSSVAALESALEPVAQDWEFSNGRTLGLQRVDSNLIGTDSAQEWQLTLKQQGRAYAAHLRPGKYATEVVGFMYMENSEKMVLLFPRASSNVAAVLTARPSRQVQIDQGRRGATAD